MHVELAIHERSLVENAIEVAVHVRIGFHRVTAGGDKTDDRADYRPCARGLKPTIHGPKRCKARTPDVVNEDAADTIGHLERDAAGAPAMTGVPFRSDSESTSPKPSRIDSCTMTSETRWNAVTSMFPMPVRFVRTWTTGSLPPARRGSDRDAVSEGR